MRRTCILFTLLSLSFVGSLAAQITEDVIGVHNLGPGSRSPVTGARPDFCLYCHAPHSGIGGRTPLWNQTLSTQVYQTYTSTTAQNIGAQPVSGADTSLCLSCHDGTVAPGTTAVFGKVTTTGNMYASDVLGTNLQPSHPMSLVLPLKDTPDLVASLVSQGKTGDPTGAVRLVQGNIECTSCHNPHVQYKDLISQNFLVRDGSSGQICLACHDPMRSTPGQINALSGWPVSIHATAANKLTPQANVGSYPTVAQAACIGCHMPHNAPGASRLLRGSNEQDCLACHSGGSNISPAPPSVAAEYAQPKVGHPLPSANNQHDSAEAALLNTNRHATCVDCHNSHASNKVATFTPAPALRLSQTGVTGINSIDGVSVLNPAVNQFENCLRCHGTSAGKSTDIVYGYLPLWAVSAGDPLNLISQFANTATSSHPVMHVRSSPFAQPSLLANMVQLDGTTQGRAMGTQIFCTDCHNADDNREFGGTGPNGPHGSKWYHILERQYQFSQAAVPGGPVTNLTPTPDTSVNGPYALCGKCHDLANQVLKDTSFKEHSAHINTGFSCSVCHTAHGMGATSATISGERLVNFDVKVVAQNGTSPISYNRAANTCVLVCHGEAHDASGNVKAATGPTSVRGGSPIRVSK